MAVQETDNNSSSSSSAGKLVKYAIVLVLLVLVGLLVGFGITTLMQNSNSKISLSQSQDEPKTGITKEESDLVNKVSKCSGEVTETEEVIENIALEKEKRVSIAFGTIADKLGDNKLAISDIATNNLENTTLQNVKKLEIKFINDMDAFTENEKGTDEYLSSFEHHIIESDTDMTDTVYSQLTKGAQIWYYNDFDREDDEFRTVYVYCPPLI